jgi:hypothetical protein
MKKRNLLVGFFSILGMATMSNTLFAQQNLGAACGCPTVATRTSAAITSVGTWTTLPSSAYGKELNGSQNITLTCDKIWTLDEKLYIASGSTLTIEPGTVIKGSDAGASVAAARAIIIERGGKIIAPGVEDCPIVFTAAADNLDGTYSVNNKGKWGGILICGTATNNLKLNGNGPFVPGQGGKMAIADGLGVLEGFASSYPQDQFGVALSVPSGATSSTSPSGSYTFGLLSTASATPASGCNGVGNTKIELNANAPAYVVQGQTVSGAGIPAGTTILSISAKQLTLSTALTAAIATSAEITFNGTYPNAGQTGYFSTMTYVAPNSGSAPVSGTSGTVASYVGAYYTSTASFNDNDNSGVLTYVSIRHSGANLLVGSEINGLTLASVGRGTKIEHIEIVSCADDNIEIFGGTVDLKYCTTLFGNDDMFDYDLGWTGRAQFLFGMKADLASGISPDNDNGFECDGDDGKTYATPISAPKIYNATVMGNAKTTSTADNTGMIGLCLKEFAGGEIRNSVFAGFKEGIRMTSVTAATASYGSRSIAFGGETVHNYLATGTTPSATTGNGSQRLKVKCNTFVGNTTNVNAYDAQTTAVAQLTADGNVFETTIPGFSSSFAITTANVVTTKNDATPNPALPLGTGCTQAPADGFFEPANYRGAFSSVAGDNWLSDWSYSELLGSTLGVVACPTDLNSDGTTDVLDFLIFGPAFGTDCN